MTLPLTVYIRDAETKEVQTFEVEPSAPLKVARRRLTERVRNHPERFDFAGVKRGDEVLLRGIRGDDGKWTWDHPKKDERTAQPGPRPLI